MGSNIEWAHTLTFYVLYVFAALTLFVATERMIFYVRTASVAKRLLAAMPHDINRAEEVPAALLKMDSVPSEIVRAMLRLRKAGASRHAIEDTSEDLYIGAKSKLSRHMWILDTVVTAAPLLGLLGTILGIIDTFTSLAQSGISDPAGVSAGIGTALFATALGISVALFGLLCHNLFQERVNRIGDYLKILLIRSGTHDHNAAALAAAE